MRTGPSVPLDGIRDQLDVRAGGNDARDRRSDDILRRRQWAPGRRRGPHVRRRRDHPARRRGRLPRRAALVREKRADVFDLVGMICAPRLIMK
jgi:hypothetical protein